jgi:hypothetical protein
MFNDPYRTSQKTNSFSVTKINQLMLYTEINAVFFFSKSYEICHTCRRQNTKLEC